MGYFDGDVLNLVIINTILYIYTVIYIYIIYGGFLSHRGTPIAGLFFFHGRSDSKMDDFGVSPF